MQNIFEDFLAKYQLSNTQLIFALRKALFRLLKLCELNFEFQDKNLIIYENFINDLGQVRKRVVKLSSKNKNKLRIYLYEEIIALLFKERVRKIKKQKIILGKIIDKTSFGLTLQTEYGKAYAPYKLLLKHEQKAGFYALNQMLEFHIYKVSVKNKGLNLILDRTSKALALHLCRQILNSHIFDIKRTFGVRTKNYLSERPQKEDLQRLKTYFNEKIIYKVI
ncbi:hypothetical protein CUPS3785_06895 [Campylobacter upsaliensis]|uniref:hypothetical protein n=1 Tax=Campylobacter upsaliensis TaxID=28080 RepID=UPI00214A334A|nr:hypothetical protein [Campylobacter upsaliensis]MCR2122804.1 hypothetical protein [Campylobacter upsaliensis]